MLPAGAIDGARTRPPPDVVPGVEVVLPRAHVDLVTITERVDRQATSRSIRRPHRDTGCRSGSSRRRDRNAVRRNLVGNGRGSQRDEGHGRGGRRGAAPGPGAGRADLPPGRRPHGARGRPARRRCSRSRWRPRRDGRVVTLDDALARARPAGDTGATRSRSPSTTAPPTSPTSRVPCSCEHRVPATLYVATDFVDRGVDVPRRRHAALVGRRSRDAVAHRACHVGSHTHTHALLDRLPAAESTPSSTASTRSSASGRRRPPRTSRTRRRSWARPPADAAVRARFRSAALAGTRPNPYGATDPYRLPLADPAERRHALVPAQGRGWHARSRTRSADAANRRRYAGATT